MKVNLHIYPSKRFTPDESKKITRHERQVQLEKKELTELVVLVKSDTGKIILDAWEEYKSFASKYQDDLAFDNDFEEITF